MTSSDTGPNLDLPTVIVSDALAEADLPCRVIGLGTWRESLIALPEAGLALAGPPPVGLALTEQDRATVDAPLTALLTAAEIVVETVVTPADLPKAVLTLMARHHARLQRQSGSDRAALAQMRVTHMQMQEDFAEVEAWLSEALTPRYKLARRWSVGPDSVPLTAKRLVQPLPVPARGLLVVDVHIAEADGGTLYAELCRPDGPALADTSAQAELHEGWVRLVLPRAPGGALQDCALAVWSDASARISLTPPQPFTDLHLREGSGTLALQLFQTLPGRPGPPLHRADRPLPADGRTRHLAPADLPKPQRLPRAAGLARRYQDYVKVAFWEKENAFYVHPSRLGAVVARVQGPRVDQLIQAAATVQLARAEAMPTRFALGVAPVGTVSNAMQAQVHLGDWLEVLPGEWADVWWEHPEGLTGEVDLLLATAMPGKPYNDLADALFRGFRLTTRHAP
ncbi:MAG: DUF6212 domain-containing protein [Pseudomonadota bacterium]